MPSGAEHDRFLCSAVGLLKDGGFPSIVNSSSNNEFVEASIKLSKLCNVVIIILES